MGLFNYSKPGSGVSKDAPPKKRIVFFFELLGRKFKDLIKVNLLFWIPMGIAVALFYLLGFWGINVIYVNYLPFILVMPFWGGLTYITRNFAREEHAFLFGDFKDTVKTNWKPFLIHGVVTYLFISLMFISFQFYWLKAAEYPILYVPIVICAIASLIFLFMQYYIPLMIVTFDLKMRDVYKNAFILAFAGFKQNLIVTLAGLVLFFLLWILMTLHYIVTLIVLLLLFLLVFSFLSFLINFTVYPVIETYLIKPLYTKSEDEEQETENREDSEEQQSEYVYENGRLIKRSLLKEETLFEDKHQ